MADTDLAESIVDMLIEITGEEEVAEMRDADLFEEGLLDSLAAIEVLVSLEDRFGVSIAPTELDRSEMNTVNKIIEQVQARIV